MDIRSHVIALNEDRARVVEQLRSELDFTAGRERTAEEIKIRIGSAYPLDEELTMEVKGRDSVAGLPKTIHVTSQEIREALADPEVVEALKVARGAGRSCAPQTVARRTRRVLCRDIEALCRADRGAWHAIRGAGVGGAATDSVWRDTFV